MLEGGIVLIDKPIGMTSRNVDNRIGKLFGTRKVGHLGTLDPFASGLLLVAVEKGTKALPYIEDGEKRYVASLFLGKATESGDCEGDLIEEKEVPPLSKEAVQKALESFLGVSEQIPPMHSAIKKDGIPLYKLAHKGESVERTPRRIEIKAIELKELTDNILTFECLVSKGTYVRVLGEDIAKKLGTVGHLLSLRRLSIGPFSVKDAIPLDEVKPDSLLDPLPFLSLPRQEIGPELRKKAENGMGLSFPREEERILLCQNDQAVAVYRKAGERFYRSERGLF